MDPIRISQNIGTSKIFKIIYILCNSLFFSVIPFLHLKTSDIIDLIFISLMNEYVDITPYWSPVRVRDYFLRLPYFIQFKAVKIAVYEIVILEGNLKIVRESEIKTPLRYSPPFIVLEKLRIIMIETLEAFDNFCFYFFPLTHSILPFNLKKQPAIVRNPKVFCGGSYSSPPLFKQTEIFPKTKKSVSPVTRNLFQNIKFNKLVDQVTGGFGA